MSEPKRTGSAPPKKIQLALQGGGAKLFALVAALRALDEARQSNRIEITRVAGTSAGAIVAILYAAGVSPETMQATFATTPIDKIVHRRINSEYRLVRWTLQLRAANSMRRGTALAKQQPIREQLEYLLGTQLKKDKQTFANLQMPAVVIASNLSTRLPEVYSNDQVLGNPATPGKSLVDAALDSSAIPFVFRTAKPDQGVLIVDGGLCANLPADYLLPDAGRLGDVFAVSFQEGTSVRSPATPLELAGAILDTAINSSVQRQKRGQNMIVVDLDAGSIGTFDFKDAQKELSTAGGGPLFRGARVETAGRIVEMLQVGGPASHVITEQIWRSAPPALLEQQYRIFASQHGEHKYLQRAWSMVVEAHSLSDPAQPDRVVFSQEFRPHITDLSVVAISIALEHELVGLGACSVTDDQQRPIPFELVPVVMPMPKLPALPVAATRRLGVLFQFTPPLAALATPARTFTVRAEYKVARAFPKLLEGHADELNFIVASKRLIAPVESVKLVLFVPQKVALATSVKAGEGLVAAHELPPQIGDHIPEGFRRLAWEARSVPSGQTVWVDLQKPEEGAVSRQRT